MGSRLRENVKQLFECFCEVAQPNGEKAAWILQRYPESYNDSEVLKSVPKFAYPCEIENVVVQHFSFVLTSIDSKWTFGFSRHDPKTETALVVLSALPWHETFYKLLNHIATLTASKNAGDLWKFLGEVYEATIPVSGASVSIPLPDCKEIFVCQRPKQFQLPSIPENLNLMEYFNAVDSHNMMMVFASMLYERRIIFTSKRLSRLSACVQACNALIYPMIWQHIYIPVLPLSLMDYLLAPMPFLIGVPTPILKRVRQSDLGEVVILNADDNTIESPFQDLESLPQDVVTNLRRALNQTDLLGDKVSRAFLRALVQLTAGYREALTLQQGQNDDHVRITFDQDAFVESRPLSMQPFLRKMLELQIFQQFIEERLHMLNSGLGFSDEFEMEACNYSDKSGNKFMQQYREWTYAMRKEGSAFIRSVKDKANPAVKYAVKSVKDKGKDMKTAYKGLKRMGRTTRGDNSKRFHQPRSAPSSPTLDRRPISFVSPSKSPSGLTPTTSYRKELRLRNSNVETSRKQYSPLNPSSPEEQDSPPERLDIDLMQELRDVIFPNTPPVDRSLKPVRSLDSLRPAWSGGRLRHGPPPSSSQNYPYEHYQLPKHSTPKPTGNSKDPLPLPSDTPSAADAGGNSNNDNENSNDNDNSNKGSNSLDMKSSQPDKAPLIGAGSSSSPPSANKPEASPKEAKSSDPSSHEFVNPFSVSFDPAVKAEGESVVDGTKDFVDKLRTEDPFELYSNPGALNDTFINESVSDPFDTSQVLNPFGFPNPLFRTNNNKLPIESPLKNVDSCSALAKDRSASDVQDLIRLDSANSDDDFDPLLARSSAAGGGVPRQMSQSLHVPEMSEGLSNPLYPYFAPQQRKSEPAAPTQAKVGDLDLLQEYGLDFNKFSLSNGTSSSGASSSSMTSSVTSTSTPRPSLMSQQQPPRPEPFGNSLTTGKLFDTAFSAQQTVKSPSNWTKFE